jgi:hypothetical protein
MSRTLNIKAWLPGSVGLAFVLSLALVLALAPGAGAGPSRAASVNVVGSGTILRKQIAIHKSPSGASRVIAVLKQFRSDYRPQFVLALSQLRNKAGDATWYRISVPGRPNGRSGWVRAAALEIHPDHKYLVVYRGSRRFEFWDHGKLARTGKVAVGKPGAETPLGLFYVQWAFNPEIDPGWAILGAWAFETSAYSKLTDWPGGGVVGVHGTPWPWLLGQAVSHGCVRMANRDILYLRTRVPLGMPVKIVRS